jgi:polygalacturonase
MATVKISQLPPAPTPLVGADLVPVVQAGTTARTTLTAVSNYVTASVKTFGAVGDGTTDDTVAIQAAVTAAGAGGLVYFPTGTYLVSSTINCLTNQQLIGNGVNNTIIRRYADYGNTFNFVNAGSANIKKMWFYHGTLPDVGFTTLSNLATTGSHIRFQNAQGALIEDCWLWRMPFQINIEQGSLIKINRCNIQGCWSPFSTAAQEGIAGVYVGSVAYTQLVDITNCYFGGSNAGAHSVNFTISDNGTQTVNFAGTNAGNKYGILAYGCEGLIVDDCYLGGNSESCILLNPARVMSQVRITNNFFDGAGYAAPTINIVPQADGQYPVLVNIADNHFNGELIAYQAIGSVNPYGSQPTIVNFQITGNTMGNNLGSGIFLRNAQGGIIANNVVAAYNARNLTPGGDVNYCTGIYVINSVSVKIDSNIVGGAVNTAYPSAYTYLGVILAGTVLNVTEKNTVHNGTGTTGTIRGRVDKYTVTSTSSANYQLLGTEEVLVVINSTAASIQVTPPTLRPVGYAVTIKDGAGNAATKPIQFMGTVDGTANPSYNTNYFYKTLLWNGTQWNAIA